VSDESSETTNDKTFKVAVIDIDGNIRFTHTARYSAEYLESSGMSDPKLIIKTMDELRKKICQQFGIPVEKLTSNEQTNATITKDAALKLTGWEEHEIENSSNLMSASYNEIDGFMDVMFKNGTEYRYKGVPRQVFEDLKKSESAGKFLNQVIKGQFKFEKLEDDGE
jgi:hypothetical protein